MRVLVVEDEAPLAEVLASGLRDAGMAVDVAHDGVEALQKAALERYDVVVLDRDLPHVHGDEVCRQLVARRSPSRILMLTAAAGVADRVSGLDLGADDYLPKPFAFAELLARLRSLGRRRSTARPPVLQAQGVVLDRAARSVTRDGRPVPLTRKELSVLEELLQAEGDVVSAEDLLERVWDENVDPFTNAVRVTVARLRAKLGAPAVIETLVGSGYRIAP